VTAMGCKEGKPTLVEFTDKRGGFFSVTGPGRRGWMATAAREGILMVAEAAEMSGMLLG
jgi:hypothetical protein